MPVLKLSSAEARKRMQGNRTHSRWWLVDSATEELRVNSACERLKDAVFRPRITPRFSITPDHAIFTIGSCFAREIEQSMIRDGMRVTSDPEIFTRWPPRERPATPWADDRMFAVGYVNKYTIGTMVDELRWASDNIPASRHPAVQEIAPGQFMDFGAHNILTPTDEAAVRARREAVSDLMRGAFTSDVIVLTLGLAEGWRDRKTGIHLVDPAITIRMEGADRFELLVVSHGDELAGLREIAALLDQHGKPDWRMVLTVSPVPLLASFTGDDIVLANSYSKSVLRAAAEEFARENDRVDYFPSYEMAMFSDPAVVWEADRRHVRRDFVNEIIVAFRDAYMRQ